MKMKTRFATLALATLLSSSVLAEIKIGVSMSTFDDNWLSYLREHMVDKAKSMPDGVQLQFEDARNDVVRQLSQVESFVGQGVDAIIVNPVDTASTRNITERAQQAGVPLIYVNRRPDESELPAGVVTVVSDDFEAGQLQMQYLADKLGGQGKIAIMLGELSNNSTRNRTKGLKAVLAQYPDIQVVEEQTALWSRNKGMDLTSNWLVSGREFDAIASNNDEMAIGAAMALRQAGVKPGTVLIGGVDGTPDALSAIQRGQLSVSVFQDAKGQADGAVESAVKMIKQQPVEQSVLIPYQLITPENVKSFQ